MSTIEERLERDIAAVTGGVVVTDSDLTEARDVLEKRMEDRRKRDRHRVVAAVAAAAVVIPVVGFIAVRTLGGEDKSAPPIKPGPTQAVDPYAEFLSGKAPTADLVNGVWRVDNGITLLRFSAPDKVSFDTRGRLFAAPAVQGTYVIAGHVMTVTVDDGSPRCGGQTFAVRASLPESGAMRFVHTKPGTGRCAPEFVSVTDASGSYDHVQWGLEQVLPTKNRSLAKLFNGKIGNWKASAGRNALDGDWMAQGGGYMLELTKGGGYVVADRSGDLVDGGRWSLRGGTLTLTSSDGSSACAPGDRLVLSALEQVNPGTSVMRGTVEQNECSAAWAPKTWILLPQDAS